MKKFFLPILVATTLLSCNNSNNDSKKSEPKSDSTSGNQQYAEPFALVELFTSEGCSDCPAAEEVLNRITKKAMADKSYIYPLALHVDYWNKLGWKDMFADTAYSNRQRKYRDAFGNEVVYTPQMIVNGEFELVGSDEKRADSIIGEYLKKKPEVYFSIHPNEDWTKVEYSIINTPDSIKLSNPQYLMCFAVVERGLVSKILRGENKGKTLVHENIVTSFNTYPIKSNEGNIDLPKSAKELSKNNSLIVFIQDTKTMKVLGANLWNY